ncbi:MAG: hypothetical protein JXA37_09380 [Chloroflexia bacterium]|nr:hypothetical protein [Chloroflexia bacterium]
MSDRRSIRDRVEWAEEPIDVLARRPESKPQRDRSWEARQRREKGVATYRGIPHDLQEEIKKVAQELHVTIGETARYFLEYALAAYRRGELEPETHDASKKQTLYPASGAE